MASEGPTTAWERRVRRREVIRLKLGKRMNAQEISEELGWSVSTIRSDLQWISDQTEKLDDPEELKRFMMEGMMHLMDHEMEDLRDADRSNDEQAKHRAKQSYRSSMKLLDEFFGDEEDEEEEDADVIGELPEDVQDELAELADESVERVLEAPE